MSQLLHGYTYTHLELDSQKRTSHYVIPTYLVAYQLPTDLAIQYNI